MSTAKYTRERAKVVVTPIEQHKITRKYRNYNTFPQNRSIVLYLNLKKRHIFGWDEVNDVTLMKVPLISVKDALLYDARCGKNSTTGK